MTQELAQILIEDAETLQQTVQGVRPKQSQIRNTAGPILRRWLVERDINKIQRALEPEKIVVRYFADRAATTNLKRGIYGRWVGGLAFNGTVVAYSSFKSEAHQKKASTGVGLHEISDTVYAFLKQKVCHIDGKTFSRKDVVYIHANQLGGAHHDPDKLAKFPENSSMLEALGYEVEDGGNIQMLLGPSIKEAKKDPNRRHKIYDLADLVLLDTAKSFSDAILNHKGLIARLFQ